ncbi:MAG: FAD-dependent oxidoreductase, partial [Verrucomicrobiales bacterium]|nr:FAD-dependent oxidoreductase [Verrucomicrobiales bacterium]
MKKNYDAIVIGTGGVGSSAVFHLAKKGANVLGLDRFPAAHDRGSSHGTTRVIRKAYFEHPGYVPLLHRAYELWDELQAESSQPLFRRHPLIEVGPPDGLIVPGVLEAARVHRLLVDSLSENDFCKTCPGLVLPEGAVALREDDAGILFVENCVREHLKRAAEEGA